MKRYGATERYATSAAAARSTRRACSATRRAACSALSVRPRTSAALMRSARVARDRAPARRRQLVDDRRARVGRRRRQAGVECGDGQRIDRHAGGAGQLLELRGALAVATSVAAGRSRKTARAAPRRLARRRLRRRGPAARPRTPRRRRGRLTLSGLVVNRGLADVAHVERALDPDRAEDQPLARHAALRSGASATRPRVSSRIASAPTWSGLNRTREIPAVTAF